MFAEKLNPGMRIEMLNKRGKYIGVCFNVYHQSGVDIVQSQVRKQLIHQE